MRYTLLEMVQTVLSALDSDEVNSIGDTIESQQVANLIKNVYYDMIGDIALPEHETVFQLNASLDADKPTVMTVPENVITLREVRYNTASLDEPEVNYVKMEYVPIPEFLSRTQPLRTAVDNVGSQQVSMGIDSYTFYYETDKAPSYYTTADDNTLIFNSYDDTVDTTLQNSKTMCFGPVYPSFSMDNDFVPDLDPSQFSLLINKSKVRAFNELKQTQNNEAAAETRRQKIIIQKRKRKTPDVTEVEKVTRFGRK